MMMLTLPSPPTQSAIHYSLDAEELAVVEDYGRQMADFQYEMHEPGSNNYQLTEEDEEATTFIATLLIGVELDVFVGLSISPGYGLVDTGAQHGVLGPRCYQSICDTLAEHGLKPRILDTLKMTASGIGGSTRFIKSAEIPVGIGGVSGTLTIHVVDFSYQLTSARSSAWCLICQR